ncbi:MAG: response regulator transcription factor [Dehalococcoidales bacterium]|nr:response regulator transcription factor [Dehalococcoidales bacterium]
MKIVIIEDDSDIREFIEIALNFGFSSPEISMTHLGRAGINLVKENKPDIVLVDLGLPDMRGFDVIKEIRKDSDVPIIIETARNADNDIVQGLTLGADDYIDKPYSQMELVARIKAVLRRTAAASSSGKDFEGVHYDDIKHIAQYKDRSVSLTPTEAVIFNAFLHKEDKRLSFDELSNIIWGTASTGANDTIRVYIHRLREKIEELTEERVSFIYRRGDAFYLTKQ